MDGLSRECRADVREAPDSSDGVCGLDFKDESECFVRIEPFEGDRSFLDEDWRSLSVDLERRSSSAGGDMRALGPGRLKFVTTADDRGRGISSFATISLVKACGKA